MHKQISIRINFSHFNNHIKVHETLRNESLIHVLNYIVFIISTLQRLNDNLNHYKI
jgi:hypothetical protein